MARQISRTLTGAFVIGAVALLITSILVFGSGRFFRNTYKAVLFFDGSVKGLSVGAPVMFRGVKVGTVADIRLIMNARDISVQTPVIIELEPDRWTLVGGERGDKANLKAFVDSGMRGQLQMQSVVTGQLLIALDFFPDKPARYVGLVPDHPEIPTVPTSLEELSRTLQDLPLRDILVKLDKIMDGIQEIVESPDLKEGVTSLRLAIEDTRALVRKISDRTDPLLTDMDRLVKNTGASVKRTEETIEEIGKDAKELVAASKKTLESAQSALARTEKTLSGFSEGSELVYEMNRAMAEVAKAARSVSLLTDYIQQHPESLLKGKPKEEGALR